MQCNNSGGWVLWIRAPVQTQTLSHSQTHWRKNRTLHLYVFQKTFWKDTQQSASLWQWLNVCVCIGSGHKTQPALLLHCTWLHCTFVFYDIKDQPWSPKDLWSLRHWWTLCLLMINMLWWFLKISKVHPYDHYNASFEGWLFTEPDHTTEYLVKRDCPATANILTLSNWSATSLLRFCRKSSDFWKVFRLSDSSQIFGRFQARWKFLWPGTESSTHILRNEKLPLRFCLPLDLPQIM